MAALVPTNPPCEFKIHIVAQASGILSYVRANGSTTTTIPLNSGTALQANSPYTFYIPINSGDTIDFQYSVATTFSELIVWELDYTIPSPMPVLGRNWSLAAADNPDITANQSKALGTSGLPVYIRPLGSTDQPDTSINQANNYKTDIGAAGTYAKDTSLGTINTTLGSPLQNDKIPSALAQDANGNIGLGLPTGALDPRQIRSLTSGDTPGKSWTLGTADNPDTSINQANPIALTENVQSGQAYYSPTGYFGAVGNYVRISFSIPANAYLKIKRVYISTYASWFRYRLSDAFGFYDNFWGFMRGFGILSSIYSNSPYENEDILINVLTNSTAGTEYNLNSSSFSNMIIVKKPLIINSGSTATSFYVELYCDGNAGGGTGNQTIAVEFEGNAAISFSNTLTSGSTGGGSTGGGGCWSADTMFCGIIENQKGIYRFSEFKIGDYLLSPNGYEQIESIEQSGMHELIELAPDTWITPLQPFKYNLTTDEIKINEIQYQHLRRKFEQSYDCRIKSTWAKTKTGIWLKDKKID